MKKIKINFFFGLFIALFFISDFTFKADKCISQWDPDVRLTNNPAVSIKSFNNANSIAVNNSFIHVVWHDKRDGVNPNLYYKRSTDGGFTWGADIRLTNQGAASVYPSVSVFGSVVHVIWQDHRSGGGKVFYKRSTDNGLNWGQEIQLSNGLNSFSTYPGSAVSGSFVHVVWQDDRDGNSEIYYANSTDGGLNWGDEIRLTNDTSESYRSSVAATGRLVHAVWVDERDGNKEIYYKRSGDAGTSWEMDVRLTTDAAQSDFPSVSSSRYFVDVVWQDIRIGGWEIYSKCSTNRGISWNQDVRITNNANNSFWPSVFVLGPAAYVVWSDVRDENWEVYYNQSTDRGATWGTDIRLTNSLLDSYYPSVVAIDTVKHVVWQDNRDGNYEIYYKRTTPNNLVGTENLFKGIPESFALYQNYPNPFNPSTKIGFDIPKSGFVSLKVYDVLGHEAAVLANSDMSAGKYGVTLNADKLAGGIYFCRLSAGNYTETIRMVLLK